MGGEALSRRASVQNKRALELAKALIKAGALDGGDMNKAPKMPPGSLMSAMGNGGAAGPQANPGGMNAPPPGYRPAPRDTQGPGFASSALAPAVQSQYANTPPGAPNIITDVDVARNWFCYSDDTQILTRHRGWVLFVDLVEGEEVATRSSDGRIEWQRPTQRVEYDYTGPMFHFYSQALDILVTPEHRMLVNSLPDRAAQKLGLARRGGHQSREVILSAKVLAETHTGNTRIPVTGQWEGMALGGLKLEPVSGYAKSLNLSGDDYAIFMGFYLSEGCSELRDGRPWRVKIGQSPKSKRLSIFADALGRMFGERVTYRPYLNGEGGGFYIHSAALTAFCRQFGQSHEKHLPDDLMNAPCRQLRLFWDAYMAGDGSRQRQGTSRKTKRLGRCAGVLQKIKTVSQRMADQLQEVALKLGHLASIAVENGGASVIRTGTGREYTSVARDSYLVSMHSKTSMRFRADTQSYAGKVYCVSVPNGIVAVRRAVKENQNGSKEEALGRSVGRRRHKAGGWLWCGNSPFQPIYP